MHTSRKWEWEQNEHVDRIEQDGGKSIDELYGATLKRSLPDWTSDDALLS